MEDAHLRSFSYPLPTYQPALASYPPIFFDDEDQPVTAVHSPVPRTPTFYSSSSSTEGTAAFAAAAAASEAARVTEEEDFRLTEKTLEKLQLSSLSDIRLSDKNLAMACFADLSLDEVIHAENMPIGSNAHLFGPNPWGVIIITNIPYTVTRQEVLQFVGRSARVISAQKGCPVHIIMERSTGKTMDCFVEFDTVAAASETVTRINRVHEMGRSPRMGNRHVEVAMSSQDELLKALFPRAKCMKWVDGQPVLQENKDWWSNGFQGFFTDEEMFCVLRHAEVPQRSSFACKVPQRTYESIISTLWKFPWHAANLYTVHARQKLYDTLRSMILALVQRMEKEKTVGLDGRLVRELVLAGLNCPVFNPRMKYSLGIFGKCRDIVANMNWEYSVYFPFDSLILLPNGNMPTLMYYANLMANGRVPDTSTHGLEQRHHHPQLMKIYGKVWFQWNEVVARKKRFIDAIAYERRVMREMVVTGYLYVSGNLTTVSSIGTAPKSTTSPAKSVDSQKTVCGSGGVSLPLAQRTSTRTSSSSTSASATLYSSSQDSVGRSSSGLSNSCQRNNKSQDGIGHVWMFPPAPTSTVSSSTDNLYVPTMPGPQTSQVSPYVGPLVNHPTAPFAMHRSRGSISSPTYPHQSSGQVGQSMHHRYPSSGSSSGKW
ncbi:hypothetical protein N7474_002392 [Penicillium riverlandense]|uniref:uncharacterized protein n=1 Tax=Penicillium riverlandense TaxID=1903569 RepID=UPI002546743C|nr:uncharacterized protein N7474_002392 [Penicillium riverlandense]KAJ5825254.1 hypothetical protein N7474_002392 [Penicillium riverlandense]